LVKVEIIYQYDDVGIAKTHQHPFYTLDENKVLALHVSIAFKVPYKLGALMQVLPYRSKFNA
jgi:hypothetical protein